MAVTVSICCSCYNHEKYIAQALEGMLSQKTEYSFEICIQDDASTDRSAEIIREYESKYPGIIKAIYHEVNQYSQGKRPGAANISRAEGKYIALCEGDDYWCDEYKLQKQISYMEEHPDCTFCFTNGYVQIGEERIRSIIPWNRSAVVKTGSFDYNNGELELLEYIPTASFVYRKDSVIPEVPEGTFRGDSLTKHAMTALGYARYIPDLSVVYRRGLNDSATSVSVKSEEAFEKACNSTQQMYRFIDEYTGHRYSDIFRMKICEWEIEKLFRRNDYKGLRSVARSGELYLLRNGNRYSRVTYNLKCRAPRIFSLMHKLISK